MQQATAIDLVIQSLPHPVAPHGHLSLPRAIGVLWLAPNYDYS